MTKAEESSVSWVSSTSATAPELQASLTADRGPAILDLREVTFIDSTGLWALLGATQGRDRVESLVLRAPAPAVRRLIELAALTERLAIEPEAPDEPACNPVVGASDARGTTRRAHEFGSMSLGTVSRLS